jgi:hypothetical protein
LNIFTLPVQKNQWPSRVAKTRILAAYFCDPSAEHDSFINPPAIHIFSVANSVGDYIDIHFIERRLGSGYNSNVGCIGIASFSFDAKHIIHPFGISHITIRANGGVPYPG